MSVESNIAAVRRWYEEIWNRGNYAVAHELLAPSARTHGQQEEPITGPEAFIEFARQIHAAFPDVHLNVEDIFGVGDRVVARWTVLATHQGALFGIRATHRRVQTYGISIIQFENGKVVAAWDCWDRAGLMQQLMAETTAQATA